MVFPVLNSYPPPYPDSARNEYRYQITRALGLMQGIETSLNDLRLRFMVSALLTGAILAGVYWLVTPSLLPIVAFFVLLLGVMALHNLWILRKKVRALHRQMEHVRGQLAQIKPDNRLALDNLVQAADKLRGLWLRLPVV